MAGGLVGLLDDIAALAKLAAASVDDIGAAAGRASVKAAGVVVDDTAVTPTYVQGLAAERELPIVKKIAKGSIRNKLVFILPVALALSQFAPFLVEIILICGGAYLCYEGAEKLLHRFVHHVPEPEPDTPAETFSDDHEKSTIAGAIRTDFILSAEIMVIALKEVEGEPLLRQAVILVVVAFVITALVYGVVAAIVKMDDAGLRLAQSTSSASQRLGRGLVNAMPKVLATLSAVGTVAMLWVGGHIIVAALDELHWWTWPYSVIHHAEEPFRDVAGIGGALAWLVNTVLSAVFGLIVGGVVLGVVSSIPRRHSPDGSSAHADAATP